MSHWHMCHLEGDSHHGDQRSKNLGVEGLNRKGSLVVTLYQECLTVREQAFLGTEDRELGL